MLTLKKRYTLKRSELSNKFRVENNNLDISSIIGETGYSTALLGSLAKATREERNKRATASSVFKYVQISDIDVELGRIKSFRTFTGSKAPNNARRIMKKGDVLVSTRRPTRGAVVAIPSDFDGDMCTVYFTTMRILDWDVLDPQYLAMFLRTSFARYQFQSMITETAYPVIGDADVENLTILYPHINEQRRLAAAYNDAVNAFFASMNAVYATITTARQAVEDYLLVDNAERLAAKTFGLSPEEIVDDAADGLENGEPDDAGEMNTTAVDQGLNGSPDKPT